MTNIQLSKEVQAEFLLEWNRFIEGKSCSFNGWEPLKELFDIDMKNLGPGCSKCKQNAIKRKYAVKVQKVFLNRA